MAYTLHLPPIGYTLAPRKLKRSETWAASQRPAAVPKLPIGGKPEKGREDTAKLMEEVQKMQAALKQEEDTSYKLQRHIKYTW